MVEGRISIAHADRTCLRPAIARTSDVQSSPTRSNIPRKANTIWELAETGADGPTGNACGDAAGRTYIAISSENTNIEITLETRLPDRETNLQTFAQTTLQILQKALTKN